MLVLIRMYIGGRNERTKNHSTEIKERRCRHYQADVRHRIPVFGKERENMKTAP